MHQVVHRLANQSSLTGAPSNRVAAGLAKRTNPLRSTPQNSVGHRVQENLLLPAQFLGSFALARARQHLAE